MVVGELEPEEVDDVADGGEGEEAPLLLPHLPRPALRDLTTCGAGALTTR